MTLGEKSTVGVEKSPSTRADLIPIAAAVGAGALLAAIELGSRSLWLDEGSTFAIASQHGSALWHGVSHDGGNMLAYYLLMHVLIAWFGHALWLLRLPSVIATAATGGLVAALALRLFGSRWTAAAAGLLAVVSLPLIFWGQNARGYAPLVALAVGSFLALTAILQTPAGRAPARGAVAAYVLTTLAALYVGYDVALLIPAQLALLPLFRERARLVIACLALVLALCVPLLVLAAERGSGQLFWVTPLSWQIAGQAAVTLLSAGLPPNFHRTATTVATVIVIGLAVLAALALAARAALPRGRGAGRAGTPGSWPLLLVLSWAVIPSVAAVVLYAAGEPIELPRITILVLPALALLLAWLPTHVPLPRFAAALLFATLLVLRLAQVIPGYGVSPENWRAATAYVLASGRPACVVLYPQDGREPFDYYLSQLGRQGGDPAPQLRPELPRLAWTSVRPFVEAYGTSTAGRQASLARVCPRVWLIASHEGQRHGTRQSRANLRRYRRLEAGFARLYPHHSLRTFGWASPVHVRSFWR